MTNAFASIAQGLNEAIALNEGKDIAAKTHRPEEIDVAQLRRSLGLTQLIQNLKSAGFYEISGGKGSHRKFVHTNYASAVTISGKTGEDAKIYQEKQVDQAIEQVKA